MDVGNKHEQTLQRTPSQLQFMSLQEHNLAAEAEWQIDGFLGSR